MLLLPKCFATQRSRPSCEARHTWPNLAPHDLASSSTADICYPCTQQLKAFSTLVSCGGTFQFMAPPQCPICNDLLRGDCYEDKPVLKERDGYVFVSASSVDDRQQTRALV
nr:putative integron gene cassette protein [uncultured bacterium]